MSWVAVAITGISLSTYSTIQSGRDAEEQGEFQAKIAVMEAEQAQRDADAQRQAAAERAVQKEREARALRGRIVGKQAVSGVEVARGSNLAVLIEAAQDAEADRLTILREGAIAGATEEFRGRVIRAEGSSAKARGRAAKRGAVLSAVGGAATGVATVGSRFSKKKETT